MVYNEILYYTNYFLAYAVYQIVFGKDVITFTIVDI